jgi:hypothetical protein
MTTKDEYTLSEISKLIEITKRDKLFFKIRSRDSKDELEKLISRAWVRNCDSWLKGLEEVKKMKMKETRQKELPK